MNLHSLASFRIDYKDFLKGNNAYDKYPEGGVLASTVGMNTFLSPGQLAIAPAIGGVVSGSLRTSGIIAMASGSAAGSLVTAALMTQTSVEARIYSLQTNGAVSTYSEGSGSVAYTLGKADIAYYQDYFYITGNTTISRLEADFGGFSWVWWTGAEAQPALNGSVPHPMVVYEGILYIADGRYLHKIDGAIISQQVFNLPDNYVITALIEYNGLIYIAADPYYNFSGDYHGGTQIFTWDGLLESWYEQYFVDYRVNAFYVYKNNLFIFNNKFMGLWDGSQLKPIRPLSSQVYKHHITSTSDSLIWADGTSIYRYGAPHTSGIQKAFYKYITIAGDPLAGIFSIDNNNLIITKPGSTAGENYNIGDINAAGTAATTFTFNKREFKRPVKIRGIVIECDAMVSGQKIKAGYINSDGVTVYSNFASGELSGAVADQVGKRIYKLEFYNNDATTLVYPIVTLTGNTKLDSVDYYYEASEDPLNK